MKFGPVRVEGTQGAILAPAAAERRFGRNRRLETSVVSGGHELRRKSDMVATLKVTPVADAAPLAEVLTGFVERNDVVLDFGASSLRDFEDVM